MKKWLDYLHYESLPSALWRTYTHIHPLYRHTFWIVFIACCVVFGFNAMHFLWGNHDWSAVLGVYGAFDDSNIGRWTQNIISAVLQDTTLLPIANHLLAFGGLAFSAVGLCVYLNAPKMLWVWAVISLILALQPFTLARAYYAYQVSGLFIALALGIVGFILAKKAGLESSMQNSNGGGGMTMRMHKAQI